MATYRTIHTAYGLEAMAAAEASSTPINLTHMAVGDGNGNDVEPTESQTELVREVFRATINRVYQDPDTPERFTAELIVPATDGGFTLREVGVFDADGNLFAVGNLPATYKPEVSDGSYADTVVRVEFMVANADVVNILVDPNVAVATQSWILNNITGATIIPGGTTGQVLTKQSNADGDFDWEDPDTANVVVDVIEEQQTLVADQTDVILSVVTTRGLAVYIEGVRIRKGAGADEWQEDGTDPETTIVLGQSYPAGTKILLTQNEPTGSVPFPLIRDQNLADVPNKATARTNLEIYSKSEVDAKTPAGMVSYFARNTAPTGWMKANGAAISRTTYATLFAAIGTTFGAGDGATTFNVPDLRGEFIRGWDNGRGVDSGRTFGSEQSDQNKAHEHDANTSNAGGHTHTASTNNAGAHAHDASAGTAGAHTHSVDLVRGQLASNANQATNEGVYGNGTTGSAGSHTHPISVETGGTHSHTVSVNAVANHTHATTIESSGGNESRPRNIALLACIKF
jgi:phage-related tail fiber protein